MPYLNRSPRTVDRLVDLDPAALAPLPTLLEGDVVRLCAIQSADGRPTVLSARSGASAALAAGAHAGPTAMSRMLIERHWRPGGRNEVVVPDSCDRPMPLLPFVRKAVEDYLKLRGNPKTGPLFVKVDGSPVRSDDLTLSLASTAELFGVRGDGIFDKLHAFFERQLDKEADRTAADYMFGRFTFWLTKQVRRAPDILPKVDALRDILEARHKLTGPADAFFGPSPSFLVDAPCNLGGRVHRRRLSVAMKTDTVVQALAAVVWPDDIPGRRRLRGDLKRRHLAYLHALWKAGRLKSVEIAWLLRIPGGAKQATQLLRHVIPAEVPTIVRTPAELRPMLIERWRARPAGEKILDFAWRMVGEIGLHSIPVAEGLLQRAGEFRRRRGRPRKVHRRAA
ncbi:MAG: hypothetical protein QHD01_16855 [Bradyrhizobium sp.]|uniref:hypothetical protein n=1 Tax=Bradyrhizobium sp. TaxID=376 RepID=UPI0029B88E9D|nr:hypothetical protein [Bradyrhizobium sp.]MDX3968255.1 hypothetical protein [Bradyrhizobium sp.]